MGTAIFELDSGDAYLPGDRVRGTVSWTLSEAPATLTIALMWYTEGRGAQDTGVIELRELPTRTPMGEHRFSFDLPLEPYSFSGTLISLRWALEFVASPSDYTARHEIVVSPTRRELRLDTVAHTGVGRAST